VIERHRFVEGGHEGPQEVRAEDLEVEDREDRPDEVSGRDQEAPEVPPVDDEEHDEGGPRL
jgi:hypothetical protein